RTLVFSSIYDIYWIREDELKRNARQCISVDLAILVSNTTQPSVSPTLSDLILGTEEPLLREPEKFRFSGLPKYVTLSLRRSLIARFNTHSNPMNTNRSVAEQIFGSSPRPLHLGISV